jgi:hypothetical protein
VATSILGGTSSGTSSWCFDFDRRNRGSGVLFMRAGNAHEVDHNLCRSGEELSVLEQCLYWRRETVTLEVASGLGF